MTSISLNGKSLLNVRTSTGGVSFENTLSIFKKITRNSQSGSVLDLSLSSSSDVVSLDHAKFIECRSSNGDGGAIAIKLLGSGGSLSISSGVLFEYSETSATGWSDAKSDAITFIVSNDDYFSSYALGSKVSDYASLKEKYYAEVSGGVGPLVPLYYYLTSPSQVIIDNSSNGYEVKNCGWDVLRCQVYSNHVTASGGSVKLVGGNFEAGSERVVFTTAIEISGNGSGSASSDSVVILRAGSGYTSSSVRMTFKKMRFSGGSLSSSLISTSSGGSVCLEEVVFHSITLSECSLFDGILGTSSSSLSITTSATFEGIKRSNNGGAILEGTVPSGGLDLSLASFKDCGTSDGESGAALKLTMSMGDLILSADKFSRSNDKWEDVKLCGVWILVPDSLIKLSPSTTTETTLKNLAVSCLDSGAWKSDYEKKHYITINNLHSDAFSHAYYTPIFAASGTSNVYVSDNGVDVPGCGWIDIPCLTVDAASNHVKDSLVSSQTINMKDGTYSIASNIHYVFSESRSIIGNSKSGVLVSVVDDANGMFSTSTDGLTITLSKMSISSPKKLFVKHSGSGSVSLESIIFGRDSSTSTISSESLISMIAGSLSMSDVSANKITLSGGPLISVRSGASISIEGGSLFVNISGGGSSEGTGNHDL